MRNLSFALTTAQMRARTKTVTRRKGTWWAGVLKPGDLVCAVEKSQGIKKGGLVRLGTIRIVSVRVERLDDIELLQNHGNDECEREGFPLMLGRGFVVMFCKHMGGNQLQSVTRIEFEHVESAVSK